MRSTTSRTGASYNITAIVSSIINPIDGFSVMSHLFRADPPKRTEERRSEWVISERKSTVSPRSHGARRCQTVAGMIGQQMVSMIRATAQPQPCTNTKGRRRGSAPTYRSKKPVVTAIPKNRSNKCPQTPPSANRLIGLGDR